MLNQRSVKYDVIKKIGSGEQRPSVGTLLQLSRTLQLDSDPLLTKPNDSPDTRADAYTKRTCVYALRPMIRIKSATDTPDFKSPSRHAKGRILDICVFWRNAEGGLKDK